MKGKLILAFSTGVLLTGLFATQSFGQAFTENFDGAFPPAGPPVVTDPIGTGASDPTEVPPGQVKWYRSDNPILATTVSGYFPNAGLNPGRGGSGFSVVLDSWGIASGGKADLIFHNVNMTSFTLPRLRFFLKNTSGDDVVKVFVRKTDTWVQVGAASYGVYADWTQQTILLSGFGGTGNDTVDIRFEGTSDYALTNYGLDDVSLDETPPMTFDAVNASQVTGDVFQAYTRQAILRVNVNTTGALPALTVSQLDFTTTGTTNVADIKNARVFFTENSATFDTTNRFGAIITAPNGAMSFTGTATLGANGSTNYFWLTYDIATNATLNNVVDATLTNVTVGGTPRVPTVTDPAGNRSIKSPTTNAALVAAVDGTSSGGRGPVTSLAFHRSNTIYKATELTNLVSGATISGIGYSIATPATAAVSGNIKIYMVNTTDVTNTRGSTWATVLTTPTAMKLVYDGPLTIPNTAGFYNIKFDSLFTYTGAGLYVAYEWNITSAISTAAIYNCNQTGVVGGQLNNQNASSFPATFAAASNFRPIVQFAVPQLLNDANVQIVYTLGKLPTPSGIPHVISASIKNNGAAEMVNYPVTLNVKGANTFTNTKMINLPTLATMVVNFDAFSPAVLGTDTVTVSVANDDLNTNNSSTFYQQVTAGTFNYGTDELTTSGVGYNTGAGIIATKYTLSDERFIRSVNVSIANNAPSAGKRVFAVVMNAAGTIIARSDTVTLTAGDLNTEKAFPLRTRTILNGVDYYVGLAQIANAAGYYPVGVQDETPTRSGAYFTSAIAGGAVPTSNNSIGRFVIGSTVEAVLPAPVTPNLGADKAICQNDVATLDAGTYATYLWSTGATTQTISVGAAGTYSVIVSNGQGLFAYDTIQVSVNPLVTASVTVDQSPAGSICAGDAVTFTATPVNGGNAPSYQWLLNGTPVSGQTAATYTSSSLANGDIVECVLTSNELCVLNSPDTSAAITMEVSAGSAPVTVQVSSSQGSTICAGATVTFTANITNGGSAPAFQWMKNGTNIAGATNSTLVTSTIANSDMFSVNVTSNSLCILGSPSVSDTLTMTVNQRPAAGYSFVVGSNGTVAFTNSTTSSTAVSHVWHFGDNTTSTLASPSHTYTASGTYQAKLVSTNGCGSDSVTKAVTVVVTGIDHQVNEREVSVYPNPSNGNVNLTLALEKADDVVLKVSNLNGQVVYTEKLDQLKTKSMSLNLTGIAAGIYTITLDGTNTHITKRLSIVE